MALNIFRNNDTLNTLKSKIDENIDIYRSGDFNEVLKDTPLTTIVSVMNLIKMILILLYQKMQNMITKIL